MDLEEKTSVRTGQMRSSWDMVLQFTSGSSPRNYLKSKYVLELVKCGGRL